MRKAKASKKAKLRDKFAKAMRHHLLHAKEVEAQNHEAPAVEEHTLERPPAETLPAEELEDQEPEAELWPANGVKVAVGVEHLQHSLRVGETGRSEGPSPEDPREVIVKLDTAAVLRPLRMPRSVLAPIGAPMSKMRLWDKCNEATKRDLLKKVGVRDPRDEVLPSSASVSLTM